MFVILTQSEGKAHQQQLIKVCVLCRVRVIVGGDAREQSNVFVILTQSEGKAHQQQLIKVCVLCRVRVIVGGWAGG